MVLKNFEKKFFFMIYLGGPRGLKSDKKPLGPPSQIIKNEFFQNFLKQSEIAQNGLKLLFISLKKINNHFRPLKIFLN